MRILKLIATPFIFCWSWLTNPLFRGDVNFRRWGVKTEDITSRCMVCGIEVDDPSNPIYPPDDRWSFCPQHPQPKSGFGSFPAFEKAGWEAHLAEQAKKQVV